MASKNDNHKTGTGKMRPDKTKKPVKPEPKQRPVPGKIVSTIDSKGEIRMRRGVFIDAATGKSSFYNGPGFD
jgi:hypothetical protein